VSASWVTFVFEAANFLLLAGVLGWLFFRPVRAALEHRRSELEQERTKAGETHRKLEAELEQARAQRADFEHSLEALRERVQHEANAERTRLLEAARTQNERDREQAASELVALRRTHAQSLSRDAALAAREIVTRLLSEVDGPELESALLGAACREVAKLRASGSLAPLVVETARALDDGALGSLARAAGVSAAEVTHRLAPDLIAGLRVLTVKGVVDISAAGLAAQAQQLLVGRLDHERSSQA
jgi:F-type H+-transporting ATPase subunit b